MSNEKSEYAKRVLGELGTVSGCIGRCQDILVRHQKSKPSAFEMDEMRDKLAKAQKVIEDLAEEIEGAHLLMRLRAV